MGIFFWTGEESEEAKANVSQLEQQQKKEKKEEKEQIKRSLELRNHEACLNVPTAKEVIN